LAHLAKHAGGVQIFDADFGAQADCLRAMEVVQKALAWLANGKQDLLVLKEPTERIRARATYRGPQDTVPQSESVADLPLESGRNGSGSALGINVLRDDYWSISQALLQ
jgi:hypothetical protein